MIGLMTGSDHAAANREHGWVPWRPVADIEPALFFGEPQSNQDGNGETEVGSKLSSSSWIALEQCGIVDKPKSHCGSHFLKHRATGGFHSGEEDRLLLSHLVLHHGLTPTGTPPTWTPMQTNVCTWDKMPIASQCPQQ